MSARFAFVRGARRREEVSAYLPDGFAVIGEGVSDGRTFYVIGGYGSHGWTLDEYVMPRLASGLMAAEEVVCPDAHTTAWYAADCPPV